MDQQAVDCNNRDPNGLHGTLNCEWEDVFAEPPAFQSIECVWKASYACFNCWKNLCYKLITLFCGICIAAEWGCEFAYIGFWHIWIISPWLKVFEINCSVMEKIYGMCVGCCIRPCCEACSVLFKSFEKH